MRAGEAERNKPYPRFDREEKSVRTLRCKKRTVLFVINNKDEAICLGKRIVTLKGKLPGRMYEVYDVLLPRTPGRTEMKFFEPRQEITDASDLVL